MQLIKKFIVDRSNTYVNRQVSKLVGGSIIEQVDHQIDSTIWWQFTNQIWWPIITKLIRERGRFGVTRSC